MLASLTVTERTDPSTSSPQRRLRSGAKAKAIEELKRLGKETWGPSYYSQMAPIELCALAGRPRAVQYGALISWLKRLGRADRADPAGALELVAHLLGKALHGEEVAVELGDASDDAPKSRRRGPHQAKGVETLEVNCPSVIHDHRFVVLGELPAGELYPAVFLQPLDGSGYWYPQVARHNPLRAGRAFVSFVRLGNPAGIWHTKKPPLDAKVRVVALEKKWDPELADRLQDDELGCLLEKLGVMAQKDTLVSRVSIQPLEPNLRDSGSFGLAPLKILEPRAESCVAPIRLDWKGGAAYIEVREGQGDKLLFQGTAAPGALLSMRGRESSFTNDQIIFELNAPGRYRVRLYPAVWSFVDPSYEWWLDVT